MSNERKPIFSLEGLDPEMYDTRKSFAPDGRPDISVDLPEVIRADGGTKYPDAPVTPRRGRQPDAVYFPDKPLSEDVEDRDPGFADPSGLSTTTPKQRKPGSPMTFPNKRGKGKDKGGRGR